MQIKKSTMIEPSARRDARPDQRYITGGRATFFAQSKTGLIIELKQQSTHWSTL